VSNRSRRRKIRKAQREFRETGRRYGGETVYPAGAREAKNRKIQDAMSGRRKGCVVSAIWLSAAVIGAIATVKGS